ncbi:hypothetical protein IDH44_21945 [Paenibacillus sp. IB182496]|uniref:Uncharacterized protein n=1 Tax=Paenibacillus sabuli TaxID=2772509 RepID=A0A927BXS5_9BACL|nr:hypothetical protein [Paenibacillus sabuli]MBD2847866.1 hypothetical protein [Paenibacillus sabuli]
MLPIHERLAELWTIRSARELTDQEQMDMDHCLAVNASYCRELAHLRNISLLASMTDDTDWQHEICRQIEKLGGGPPTSRR